MRFIVVFWTIRVSQKCRRKVQQLMLENTGISCWNFQSVDPETRMTGDQVFTQVHRLATICEFVGPLQLHQQLLLTSSFLYENWILFASTHCLSILGNIIIMFRLLVGSVSSIRKAVPEGVQRGGKQRREGAEGSPEGESR